MMQKIGKIWKRAARSQAGFTLAELLVVVGIVVGLGAVILPNVGRFPGGAQWAALVTTVSISSRPSPTPVEQGRLHRPARCIAVKRKSPDRSPVNIRPVRFAPCAPGASPTISSPARLASAGTGGRRLGTGLPQ